MKKKIAIIAGAVLIVVAGVVIAVTVGKGNNGNDTDTSYESVSENSVSESSESSDETLQSEPIIDTNVPNSTVGHLNPDGNFEYNVVKSERVLAEEYSENDNYTWNYTVVSYEENDKIKFVGININSKESTDSADAEVIINYDDMTYTCDAIYRVGEDVERISFEGNADEYNPVTENISAENRSGFDEVIKDVIYKMFH